MIVCAGNIEKFSFATSIGIGLVDCTINLTRQCLFNKPDHILFIGSAGSYGKYDIFDIVTSNTASNIELSFLRDDSYSPINNVLESQNKFVKNNTIVNSSNYISTNFALSKKFNDFGIGIENMEFYSILSVAKHFEIPVAGYFIITNYTNKSAHDDFKNNHKKSMNILTNYLLKKNIIQE